MRTLVVAIVIIALAGCGNSLEPEGKRAANALELRWASQLYPPVASCLGMTSYHGEARYWVVDRLRAGRIDVSGGGTEGDDIYVVGDFFKPYTLRHEIMHHVLWRNTGDGDGRHRRADWVRCGDPRLG